MIIVTNTEATILFEDHSISLIWLNISIPTITNAAVVTEAVNNERIVGAINIERINNIPIVIAVRPVLPPSPIPVALSTYAVTVLDPKIAPIIPPIASLKNALLIPSVVPSSLTYPHSFARGINVPVVSKNVTKIKENKIIIKAGIFLNNSPNPCRNPPNRLKSKLKDTQCEGIVGIATAGSINPSAVKMTPIIAVATNPKNTAAGTFCK